MITFLILLGFTSLCLVATILIKQPPVALQDRNYKSSGAIRKDGLYIQEGPGHQNVLLFLQNDYVRWLNGTKPELPLYDFKLQSFHLERPLNGDNTAINVEKTNRAVVAKFQTSTNQSHTLTCLLKADGYLQVFDTYSSSDGYTMTEMYHCTFVNGYDITNTNKHNLKS